MKKTLRKLWYTPRWVFYHYIQVPILGWIDDYKHRNDPPLPPVPCQFCGQTGHKTKYCPNAKDMGF